MNDADFADPALELLLARTCAGDIDARNELFDRVYRPLECITHRRHTRFPVVRRWDEAGDVLAAALCRLLLALARIKPVSMSAFYDLAGAEIRWEYLDRTRRYSGPAWRFTHSDLPPASSDGPPAEAVLDMFDTPEELEDWTALHEEIKCLPTAEREVASLRLYDGLTEARIADLFVVSDRTVRHRWQSAVGKLRLRVD